MIYLIYFLRFRLFPDALGFLRPNPILSVPYMLLAVLPKCTPPVLPANGMKSGSKRSSAFLGFLCCALTYSRWSSRKTMLLTWRPPFGVGRAYYRMKSVLAPINPLSLPIFSYLGTTQVVLEVFLQVIDDLTFAVGAARYTLQWCITTLWTKLLFHVGCNTTRRRVNKTAWWKERQTPTWSKHDNVKPNSWLW